MLVLTRNTAQKIIIGNSDEPIEITVLRTTSGHVKLGITAPKSIPVHREEIYEKINAPVSDQKALEDVA